AVVLHNSTFLLALVTVTAVGALARGVANRGAEDENGNPTVPPPVEGPEVPENLHLVWLGRLWLFVPQMIALVLAYTDQPVFMSRYLSYTTLGGAILLAYWATRDRAREVRLGVSAAVVLAVYLTGFMTISRGYPATSAVPAPAIVKALDTVETKGSWKPGYVVLYRPRAL